MRQMTDDELTMFQILKNKPECRMSNWEAVREFYMYQYGISLPKLKGLPTIWTIERMIRTLKSEYPNELTDKEERQIKADMQCVYKDMAVDRNKPIKPACQVKNKPQEKFEQVGLGTMGRNKEWW